MAGNLSYFCSPLYVRRNVSALVCAFGPGDPRVSLLRGLTLSLTGVDWSAVLGKVGPRAHLWAPMECPVSVPLCPHIPLHLGFGCRWRKLEEK